MEKLTAATADALAYAYLTGTRPKGLRDKTLSRLWDHTETAKGFGLYKKGVLTNDPEGEVETAMKSTRLYRTVEVAKKLVKEAGFGEPWLKEDRKHYKIDVMGHRRAPDNHSADLFLKISVRREGSMHIEVEDTEVRGWVYHNSTKKDPGTAELVEKAVDDYYRGHVVAAVRALHKRLERASEKLKDSPDLDVRAFSSAELAGVLDALGRLDGSSDEEIMGKVRTTWLKPVLARVLEIRKEKANA